MRSGDVVVGVCCLLVFWGDVGVCLSVVWRGENECLFFVFW